MEFLQADYSPTGGFSQRSLLTNLKILTKLFPINWYYTLLFLKTFLLSFILYAHKEEQCPSLLWVRLVLYFSRSLSTLKEKYQKGEEMACDY